ncbi:hypothetical protein HN018_24270 (plasmid) [Lichenicola cladoniae]|uniref:Uncharacterized protein n=1 Tax=Lichenicola cladoniae TaxID=1484109 RepID=A0A6M8HYA1_9PROT|nr:hypothetical protein [Lichenicola cladoniae]NPD70272.1 hypothetical protein [Acetobacteraceae bacterium]QKE93328.1 hypothetical protein HN018_24270 [Lichenicola cladoniae]
MPRRLTKWLPLIALNVVVLALLMSGAIIPIHASPLTKLLGTLILGGAVQGLYGYIVGFPFGDDPKKRFFISR